MTAVSPSIVVLAPRAVEMGSVRACSVLKDGAFAVIEAVCAQVMPWAAGVGSNLLRIDEGARFKLNKVVLRALASGFFRLSEFCFKPLFLCRERRMRALQAEILGLELQRQLLNFDDLLKQRGLDLKKFMVVALIDGATGQFHHGIEPGCNGGAGCNQVSHGFSADCECGAAGQESA